MLIIQPAEMVRHEILRLTNQAHNFLNAVVGTRQQHQNFPADIVSQQLEKTRRSGSGESDDHTFLQLYLYKNTLIQIYTTRPQKTSGVMRIERKSACSIHEYGEQFVKDKPIRPATSPSSYCLFTTTPFALRGVLLPCDSVRPTSAWPSKGDCGRFLLTVKLCGNLCHTGPKEGGREYVTFARSQRIVSFRECGEGQLRINHPLTLHHAAQGDGEFCCRSVLEQKSHCATLHRPAQIAAAAKGGQDHTAAGWQRRSQRLCSGESIASRHFNVEQGDIRLARKCGFHDLVSSCDLGHHLNILFPAQQGGERTTYHRLIFRQQHSDHMRSSCKTGASPPRWTGSSTQTRKCSLPDKVRGPASIRPPSALTRSRRPASPRPGRAVLSTCSRWPPSFSTSATTVSFFLVT